MTTDSELSNRRHPAPELTEPTVDAEWAVGDFTLISSDGVIFKVDTHVLLGASAVLRGMPGLVHGQRELALTDPVIECAVVLRLFLNLITKGTVEFCPPLEHMSDLRTFCHKYDCDVAACLLVALIKDHAVVQQRRISLVEIFTIGALSDDVELCTAALQVGCQRFKAYIDEVGSVDDELFPCGLPHTKFSSRFSCCRGASNDLVTVHDLSMETFMNAPPEYIWALYRATSVPTTFCDVTFRRLVLAAKEHAANTDWTLPCPQATVHEQWTEGDVELIASDNVSFYVRSALINVASPVLARRLQETPNHIRFEDREVESSHVIFRFLTLIETGKVETSPVFVGAMSHGVALGVFLQRYECDIGKHIFSLHLRLSRGLGIQSLLIAAVMDNRQLGASLIAAGDKNKTVWIPCLRFRFFSDKRTQVVQPEEGEDVFDPLSWSFAMWRMMPSNWLYAICRGHDSKTNSVEAAKLFYNLLFLNDPGRRAPVFYHDTDDEGGDGNESNGADGGEMASEDEIVTENAGDGGDNEDVTMGDESHDTGTGGNNNSNRRIGRTFQFFLVDEYSVHHVDIDTDDSYVPSDSENHESSDSDSDPEAEEYDCEPNLPPNCTMMYQQA